MGLAEVTNRIYLWEKPCEFVVPGRARGKADIDRSQYLTSVYQGRKVIYRRRQEEGRGFHTGKFF